MEKISTLYPFLGKFTIVIHDFFLNQPFEQFSWAFSLFLCVFSTIEMLKAGKETKAVSRKVFSIPFYLYCAQDLLFPIYFFSLFLSYCATLLFVYSFVYGIKQHFLINNNRNILLKLIKREKNKEKVEWMIMRKEAA